MFPLPRKLKYPLIAALLLVVVAGVVRLVMPPLLPFAVTAAENTASAKVKENSPPTVPGALTADNRTFVEAMQVTERDFQVRAAYVGHLLPWERVVLRAEIEGVAEKVSFEESHRVANGEVLAHLSSAQREVQVGKARSDLKLAESAYNRVSDLYGKKLTPQAALDEAMNRRDVARYTLQLAEIELRKSMVKSPISGMIKERGVEPGEFLNKGQLIAEILDLSRLRVSFNVPEREFRFIAVGNPAKVTVDALPGRQFPGTVHRIGLEADLKSRTFEVEVALDNKGAILRPGMLSRVGMALAAHKAQLLVPRHAVLERENGRVLFLAQAGKAVERPITTGVSSGDEVQITGGLEAGEWVIVAGHRRLTPGEPIRMRRIGQ